MKVFGLNLNRIVAVFAGWASVKRGHRPFDFVTLQLGALSFESGRTIFLFGGLETVDVGIMSKTPEEVGISRFDPGGLFGW